MSLLRLVLPLALCSCATAADNDVVQPDASADARMGVSFPDAAPKADAGPQPDAPPISMIDASVPSIDADLSSGGLCDDNSECNVSGECCFVVCLAGTELGDACLPD